MLAFVGSQHFRLASVDAGDTAKAAIAFKSKEANVLRFITPNSALFRWKRQAKFYNISGNANVHQHRQRNYRHQQHEPGHSLLRTIVLATGWTRNLHGSLIGSKHSNGNTVQIGISLVLFEVKMFRA